MVLGPAWRAINANDRPAAEGDELLPTVRAAAEQLVERLRRAEDATRGWSDRKLTEGLVDAALSQCLRQLAATGCWGKANQLPSSELWRIAGPLLETGLLQYCARFKPHGYAGDYEMLCRICEDYCCDHPLGRAFDRYFQNQAAPQAVRSRTEQTAAALASHCLGHGGGAYRVVSVGSGPAIDVHWALEMLPEDRRKGWQVTLLDLDPDALDFARRRLEPLVPEKALRCVRSNLFRLAQDSGLGEELGRPALLVCSGLFDYLDEESAVAMLRVFWQQLAEGGVLLVGNFAPHNPTRAYMEWIGNWYLTYRTAEEVERLGFRAGISPNCLVIGSERLGVDLFLIARKA